MNTPINLRSEQIKRGLEAEKQFEDYFTRRGAEQPVLSAAELQAREDDDQAAYLRGWDREQTVKKLRRIATRQPRRHATGREIATWLALACLTVPVLRAPWWLPPLIDALGWAGK